MLRGRREQCAVLDGLIESARAGRSGTLVVRGDPGAGKTALLEYQIESASDLSVLRASGVESERELAFAALHQLCMPLTHLLDRLPDPQRKALAVAFGLSDGAAPDRFLVGLAVLSLLSEAAQERPLLCVVDDAQWLDRELEAVDPDLARATYLEALSAAMFAGRLFRGGGTAEVSEAALAGPAPPHPPRPSDLLLQGLAVRFTDGYAAGAPILKEALRAFARETVLPPQEARWLWFASWVALYLWDDEAWTVLSTRQLELVREAGALTALPFVLTNRSSVLAFCGELGVAASLEEELRAATEATGIAPVPYGALALAALRGHEAELSRLIETSVGEAEARGEGLALTVTEFLSGTLYDGLDRAEEALAVARRAEPFYEEGPAIWTLTEVIEAAVRSGHPELAAHALARLVETTRASGTDWALGIEARCRALLSSGDASERLYREAIERLGRTRIRVQLARTHLLYGESPRPLTGRAGSGHDAPLLLSRRCPGCGFATREETARSWMEVHRSAHRDRA